MRPALSVVFLTTLIGAGQGLVVALVLAGGAELPAAYGVAGAALACALTVAGLVASFLHLGRPERAWRAAAMWRTSWLSREVIALPAFIAATAAFGAGCHYGWTATPAIGVAALLLAFALYFCTAMIYACVRFLQEWASPWTPTNFLLMGCASGFTLATALAASLAPAAAPSLRSAAVLLTVCALVARALSLQRNARLRPRTTIQSATGLAHPKVRQVTQGFTAKSFNTIEFFHGASPGTLRLVRLAFMALAFVAPAMLLLAGPGYASGAAVVQMLGLFLERWYFLADARHPQNLYYQNAA